MNKLPSLKKLKWMISLIFAGIYVDIFARRRFNGGSAYIMTMVILGRERYPTIPRVIPVEQYF